MYIKTLYACLLISFNELHFIQLKKYQYINETIYFPLFEKYYQNVNIIDSLLMVFYVECMCLVCDS